MFRTPFISKFEKGASVDDVIGIVSRAWIPQIINFLGQSEKLRYNDIKRKIAGVSSTSLSRALAILEANGFIIRQVENTTPPSVSYSLTEKGREMEKLIVRMIELGEKWQLGIDDLIRPDSNANN